MYNYFTTISLEEYNKIIKVIDSIDLDRINAVQYSNYYKAIYNMIEFFSNHLDYRSTALKKDIKSFNMFTKIKERNKYNKFATLLLEDLIKYFKDWTEIMNSLFSQSRDSQEIDNHIIITGFQ